MSEEGHCPAVHQLHACFGPSEFRSLSVCSVGAIGDMLSCVSRRLYSQTQRVVAASLDHIDALRTTSYFGHDRGRNRRLVP